MSTEDAPEAKMRCEDALAEIYLLLDRECSPQRDAELRRHIDDCPPCLEEYGIDEQLKHLLARKCGGDHAPADLKSRLRASIRQTVATQGGVTVERTEITVEQRTGE
ncbi:mycothiol system anti-sigma-R factor [Amycolatopsis jiangsuensis]|uniref:Mycothiol system anti-sigma-R factor n=1 Tax=Amycolatopsis jiangsuensis TaxID=1181879 RepID=A0A840J593_9PSEU|nr:mycothiol system anti-sigma-R factor [Amycolatopsis jiangsuensis]MBB4688578.1 mycothiol system anti-sigma-R factor [Amycolatopsis jiangsuensis]